MELQHLCAHAAHPSPTDCPGDVLGRSSLHQTPLFFVQRKQCTDWLAVLKCNILNTFESWCAGLGKHFRKVSSKLRGSLSPR